MSDFRNRSSNSSDIKEIDFNKSQIGQSGNSDVDVSVNVTVDTTSIAYAYLCSMLATNKMSNEEFEAALNKLEELTNRHNKKNEKNKTSHRVEAINHHRERKRHKSFW